MTFSIDTLRTTQRTLKRRHLIPEMVRFVEEGGVFDDCDHTIEIMNLDGGLWVVNNGHHRVVAAYLAKRDLFPCEFRVYYLGEFKRLICGTIPGLAKMAAWSNGKTGVS